MKSAIEMELEITQHQVAELTKERDELRRKLAESEAEAEKWRRNLQYELCQNAPLRKALKPFAEFYEGDLADIGGGTEVAPFFKVQHFKDAKAAMKMMDAKEG